jgi:uncharacterized protein (TIGR03083 family)
MDAMELARAEQADLVVLLETLTPAQWDAPSLCDGWRVRDVVAHLVSYDGVEAREVGRRHVRTRFSPNGANASGVADFSTPPPGELVELLHRAEGTRGLPARLAGWVVLTDTLIHHQDIRRPLGLQRDIPPERLRAALRFATFAPPLRGFWHARGVRVVSTDVEWAFGRGPEARGPAEAVLMTLAARRGAAGDLHGPGAERLARRFG